MSLVFLSALGQGVTENKPATPSFNTQTLPVLEAANNIEPVVSGNQLLAPVVVDDEALSPQNPLYLKSEVFSSGTTDEITTYIVKKGDTVSTIADMFGVTSNTIRWANNLDTKSPLKLGQNLVILPISGVKYTVKKGDTLKAIATKFKGDEQEISSFNSVSSDSLVIGDQIIIPNGEISNTVVLTGKTTIKNKILGKNTSSGYFMRPINGGIKTQGIHGHNGVDLASKLGTPVMAAADGKVIVAKQGGWNGGYGNYVVISHANGMQTLYGHLNSVSVSPGDSVSQGEVIGGMGNTGQSTGVHLHFEVRGGNNPF